MRSANNLTRHIFSLASISFAVVSFATPVSPINYCNTKAFVIGAQGGYAQTHWNNLERVGDNEFIEDIFPTIDSSTSKDDGFVVRGYIGYNISLFFALESGFTYFPHTHITTFFDDGAVTEGEIKTWGIDLLAKIMLPVVNGFYLFATAGGNYLHSDINDGINTSTKANNIGPAFGVGAAYEVTPCITLDISWLHYSGNDQIFNSDGSLNGSYQPNPDMGLIGVSFKFPIYTPY